MQTGVYPLIHCGYTPVSWQRVKLRGLRGVPSATCTCHQSPVPSLVVGASFLFVLRGASWLACLLSPFSLWFRSRQNDSHKSNKLWFRAANLALFRLHEDNEDVWAVARAVRGSASVLMNNNGFTLEVCAHSQNHKTNKNLHALLGYNTAVHTTHPQTHKALRFLSREEGLSCWCVLAQEIFCTFPVLDLCYYSLNVLMELKLKCCRWCTWVCANLGVKNVISAPSVLLLQTMFCAFCRAASWVSGLFALRLTWGIWPRCTGGNTDERRRETTAAATTTSSNKKDRERRKQWSAEDRHPNPIGVGKKPNKKNKKKNMFKNKILESNIRRERKTTRNDKNGTCTLK